MARWEDAAYAKRLPEILNVVPKPWKAGLDKYHRNEDLLASATARLLLAHALRNYPGSEELTFVIGERGKPAFRDTDLHQYGIHTPLHFSLSHTSGAAACAIFCEPVGVDIESDRNTAVEWVRNVLTPLEIQFVENSSNAAKSFLYLWTRKEALIKADGRGLYAPLRDFDVLDSPAKANGTAWHLASWQIESFTLSVASSDAHLLANKPEILVASKLIP